MPAISLPFPSTHSLSVIITSVPELCLNSRISRRVLQGSCSLELAEKEMAKMAALFRPISRWESTRNWTKRNCNWPYLGKGKGEMSKAKTLLFHSLSTIAIPQYIFSMLSLYSRSCSPFRRSRRRRRRIVCI